MSSPFLDVSPDAWVASNGLAFAIRDGYPVSEGHTLVIPRRVVATWFDASEEERTSILALVDRVKADLDASHAPDGYNVGFNVGEVAGQTVMHLHVHVIPRYRGDMDDPTGGVRNVIPSRGNYRRKAKPLATGGEDDPLLRHLTPLFRRAQEICIVAAFIQQSGLERLRFAIDDALARGARVRIITGDYLNITQAAALEDLLDWMSTSDAPGEEEVPAAGHLLARIVEVERLEGRTRAFHPKSWRFEADDMGVAFVGSSNISRSALETGIEWNLRVDRDRDCDAYDRIGAAFEDLWSLSSKLDAAWVDAYARRARRVMVPLPVGEEDSEPVLAPPEPHEIQREVLERLEETRDRGFRRGLVVMATGLGKTWLAAFDVAAFADEVGRMPRVLFLAHRREILGQAARTFRTLLRSRWPEARVGWLVGSQVELEADIVFASIQKISRPEYLSQLTARAFDYIVVDEVHHAAAPSYRRVLDHLEPIFALGLTATPERADEADILGLFEDNLVHRADIGVGIGCGRLVPFDYYGLKDDVDYAAIPWRNRRFDPELLAAAVQTERRMQRLWKAWADHPGQRSLVFCASIAHAEYVKHWLARRGVRVRAVHSASSSDDRDLALDELSGGVVDAVCSVDVFNEGIDLPSIDRVVLLRPTESPIVFLQQLGRGLRSSEHSDKERLCVIDFVGNHRVFLDRVRRLLSLAAGPEQPDVAGFLDSSAAVELPSGCSVDVELEAKELLRAFLPRGRSEVERVYREIYAARGERPTAGELQRMGYLPSSIRREGTYNSWFEFVEGEGHLAADEQRAFAGAGGWFRELETTAMTKCFKMVTLEAILETDTLADGLKLADLAERCHAILQRSPGLWQDVQDGARFAVLDADNRAEWISYWKNNPIAAWTNPGRSQRRVYFRVDVDRFVPELPIAEDSGEAFQSMTRELVDLRLAQYRARARAGEIGRAFDCKITWNKRDPILKLPARTQRPDLPTGEVPVRLRDGAMWSFRFAKEFCNVARPAGVQRNQLADLLRGWYGPRVGEPGTNFSVRFERSPDGWWIERLAEIIPLSRGLVTAYPDLRVAAGAAIEAITDVEADQVALPIERAGEGLFAVRAAGSSMDGGKRPIRDGDWLIMRLARSAPLSQVEGRVALVQVADEAFGSRYQVKRIVRGERGWILRSDNPDIEDFPTSADTVPIALLDDIIGPETLAPPVGTRIPDADLATAFGLSQRPITGRVDGHLFFLVEESGVLLAPDRISIAIERRPGETAFVLTRTSDGDDWRYAGVARWSGEEGLWAMPDVDFETWRALGQGRSASRRLPPAAMERAERIVDALLTVPGPGGWSQLDERRCRIVGRSPQGGLRIDGGPEEFAERTISVLDMAWVLATKDSVEESGGLLDEATVNRHRYLEGTPKASTRWIDTGWALVLVNAARSPSR